MATKADRERWAYLDRALIGVETALDHDHGPGLFCVLAVAKYRDDFVESWVKACEDQHRTVDGRRIVWRER